MRHVALIVVALAWGCAKDKDAVVDTDTEVVDTEVVDTDVNTGPPAEKDFEVDPDVTPTFEATFSMNGNDATYALTDKVTYDVAKLAGKWYRHFSGAKDVDNIWTDTPATITLAMDVVVPNDDPETGIQSCKGQTDYAVLVALKAGQQVVGLSSVGLEKNPTAGDCNINIHEISTSKFEANIREATVTTGKDQQTVATVSNVEIKIKLRPK